MIDTFYLYTYSSEVVWAAAHDSLLAGKCKQLFSDSLITSLKIIAVSGKFASRLTRSLSNNQWAGCKIACLAHLSAPFRPIATAIALKRAKTWSQIPKLSLQP
jgi:hypothetical protein